MYLYIILSIWQVTSLLIVSRTLSLVSALLEVFSFSVLEVVPMMLYNCEGVKMRPTK